MLSDVVLQLLYTDTTAADVSETVDSVSSFELGSDASVAMVVSNNQQSGREREARGVFFSRSKLHGQQTTSHAGTSQSCAGRRELCLFDDCMLGWKVLY